MAKAKGRPKKSAETPKRHDRAVKVDAKIVGWAELIARGRGVTLAEYLSETLEGPVARDYAKLMEQLKSKGGEPKE